MITITDKAAEQMKKIARESGAEELSLRVAVVGGGCSGYQYKLGFDRMSEGDIACEANGISVVIDEKTAPAIQGLELDFIEDLEGSNFVYHNPNAVGGCGCGKSFAY